MYAIIETGGFQFRVEPGMKLNVPRIVSGEGDSINLDQVLLVGEGDDVEGATDIWQGRS